MQARVAVTGVLVIVSEPLVPLDAAALAGRRAVA
jgi:hypothetical protein